MTQGSETPPAAELSDEDAAFLALLAGLHRQIGTMRLVFPAGRHGLALIAMQQVLAEFGASVAHEPGR